MPSEKEVEDLKRRYAALTDYDVAEMHGVGRAGLVSEEAWELLKAEYERRQLEGSDIEEAVKEDHLQAERCDALQAIQAPFLARVVQGGMDTLVAGGIAFFPALIVSETFGDQPDAATILFMLLFFAYQPFFEIRSQASPVMRVFGMRVVTEAGDRPSKLSLVFRSILRPIGPILLVSMIWPITFLVLARSPWTHDFLTGTRIIIAHKSQG